MNHTRPCTLVQSRLAVVNAALVEDPHHGAVPNASGVGVLRVHLEHRLGFDVTQTLHIDKGGVQKISCRWRNHGQRITAAWIGHLVIGQMVGQAIEPLVGQALAEKLAAPRWRRKAAFCKRGIWHRQSGKPVRQQLLKVLCITNGTAAQAFIGFRKTRRIKSHAGGQCAKNLGVGAGLPHGRNGWPVQQHIGVTITGVNVPVLKLRGGRQDEVGVVSGIGLKMLQHHGEQILTRKALNHLA